MRTLAIISTHPIQYQAPVWQEVRQCGIDARVIYGSDFSVAGYRDAEFETTFAWDVNLIPDPDSCMFLSRVQTGGAKNISEVQARGIDAALDRIAPAAALLTGYGHRFHLAAFSAAWRRRIPLLFRAETADHTNKRNSVKKAIRSRALRLFYSRFRRLLPIGVRSYGHYRALGCPENKLVFSPYCVHAQHFQPQESGRYLLRSRMRSHLAAADSDIVLALVGKLSARKGVHVLVKAVKLLPSSLRQRILLLFAGNGAGRHELETACDQDPSVRAHFAGFRNQSELSAIYHASDILVLPSISGETWGLVVNEALLHGVPCIVSDAVGCAPDLVEEGVTGSVCCAGNPAGLASAIEKSLPLLGNASTRERCRAKISGYSVQAAAAGVAAAFEQVLQFA